MKGVLRTTFLGIEASLRKRSYRVPILALAAAIFVLVPTTTVIGNTLRLQLSVFRVSDFVLLTLLSLLYALFATMQVYAVRESRRRSPDGDAHRGGFP